MTLDDEFEEFEEFSLTEIALPIWIVTQTAAPTAMVSIALIASTICTLE